MSERVKFVYVATNFSLFNMWSEKPSGIDFAQKKQIMQVQGFKNSSNYKKNKRMGSITASYFDRTPDQGGLLPSSVRFTPYVHPVYYSKTLVKSILTASALQRSSVLFSLTIKQVAWLLQSISWTVSTY
jgi:hypothetical protein